MPNQDLLIELGTEELPPKALSKLSQAFKHGVNNGLKKAGLNFSDIECFASPRRLALIVGNLQGKQDDSNIERLGPAIQAAFDENGDPTKAAEGFARSCGVSVEELDQKDDGKVTKLLFKESREGATASSLIPNIVNEALAQLPIPKRMRWGSSRVEFVRPVHWLVLLFGKEVIPANILELDASNITFGHRFHHPEAITLNSVTDYVSTLEDQGFVIPSFEARRNKIRSLIEAEGQKLDAKAIVDDALLNEVTALVEWPVALTGSFHEGYLNIPDEALISSLKEHQKCFYLVDNKNKILPNFITISNLVSTNPQEVIKGNEKVIGPRLADAAFFYKQDKKHSLDSRRDKLSTVVFQQSLGSLLDKSDRVAKLSIAIANTLKTDPKLSERAAALGKCDLLTSMVGEFPDLQGTMGYYYALNDKEPEEVALALKEQYLPRFSGDSLPTSKTGVILALAERLDTVVGLFGIGQPPTGSKDPFALRRATLGILRIIVEKKLNLNLRECIQAAINGFDNLSHKEGLENIVLDFVFDRFKAWYADLNIDTKIFQAVDAVRPDSPLEFDLRVKAVNNFAQLPQAQALASANKRVANILAKLDKEPSGLINEKLLTEDAEISLANKLETLVSSLGPKIEQQEFTAALEELAGLQGDLDSFFATVMVNAEDQATRTNRQVLLQQLRGLFLQVADISVLQSS